jgi:hypothetical protein
LFSSPLGKFGTSGMLGFFATSMTTIGGFWEHQKWVKTLGCRGGQACESFDAARVGVL